MLNGVVVNVLGGMNTVRCFGELKEGRENCP